MTDMHKVFCKNLTLLRKKRGLTQEAFAEKLGTSVRYAQYLEYGYKEGINWPSPSKLRQLARILKCDTSDFFKPLKK
ncbi:helix-turn-helix domain-containing protein [Bdellovibrio bacteriovorus]